MSMIVKVKSMLNIEISVCLSNILSIFTTENKLNGVEDRICKIFFKVSRTLLSSNPIFQLRMKDRRSSVLD